MYIHAEIDRHHVNTTFILDASIHGRGTIYQMEAGEAEPGYSAGASEMRNVTWRFPSSRHPIERTIRTTKTIHYST
jgi:hypothetical protein